MLKMKKIDHFISNCSRYKVQLFVLEVLMGSFERLPLEKLPPEGVFAPGDGGGGPLLKRKLYID